MRERAAAFGSFAPHGEGALRFHTRSRRLVGLLDQRAHSGAAPLVLSVDGRAAAGGTRAAGARMERKRRACTTRRAFQSGAVVRLIWRSSSPARPAIWAATLWRDFFPGIATS